MYMVIYDESIAENNCVFSDSIFSAMYSGILLSGKDNFSS
ncbi:hypothetical protein E27107_390048 [Elizabethkingia anophelis]|nr:hypothetical protein E27107_390048 [Elizabethkingia anophelis]